MSGLGGIAMGALSLGAGFISPTGGLVTGAGSAAQQIYADLMKTSRAIKEVQQAMEQGLSMNSQRYFTDMKKNAKETAEAFAAMQLKPVDSNIMRDTEMQFIRMTDAAKRAFTDIEKQHGDTMIRMSKQTAEMTIREQQTWGSWAGRWGSWFNGGERDIGGGLKQQFLAADGSRGGSFWGRLFAGSTASVIFDEHGNEMNVENRGEMGKGIGGVMNQRQQTIDEQHKQEMLQMSENAFKERARLQRIANEGMATEQWGIQQIGLGAGRERAASREDLYRTMEEYEARSQELLGNPGYRNALNAVQGMRASIADQQNQMGYDEAWMNQAIQKQNINPATNQKWSVADRDTILAEMQAELSERGSQLEDLQTELQMQHQDYDPNDILHGYDALEVQKRRQANYYGNASSMMEDSIRESRWQGAFNRKRVLNAQAALNEENEYTTTNNKLYESRLGAEATYQGMLEENRELNKKDPETLSKNKADIDRWFQDVIKHLEVLGMKADEIHTTNQQGFQQNAQRIGISEAGFNRGVDIASGLSNFFLANKQAQNQYNNSMAMNGGNAALGYQQAGIQRTVADMNTNSQYTVSQTAIRTNQEVAAILKGATFDAGTSQYLTNTTNINAAIDKQLAENQKAFSLYGNEAQYTYTTNQVDIQKYQADAAAAAAKARAEAQANRGLVGGFIDTVAPIAPPIVAPIANIANDWMYGDKMNDINNSQTSAELKALQMIGKNMEDYLVPMTKSANSLEEVTALLEEQRAVALAKEDARMQILSSTITAGEDMSKMYDRLNDSLARASMQASALSIDAYSTQEEKAFAIQEKAAAAAIEGTAILSELLRQIQYGQQLEARNATTLAIV